MRSLPVLQEYHEIITYVAGVPWGLTCVPGVLWGLTCVPGVLWGLTCVPGVLWGLTCVPGLPWGLCCRSTVGCSWAGCSTARRRCCSPSRATACSGRRPLRLWSRWSVTRTCSASSCPSRRRRTRCSAA